MTDAGTITLTVEQLIALLTALGGVGGAAGGWTWWQRAQRRRAGEGASEAQRAPARPQQISIADTAAPNAAMADDLHAIRVGIGNMERTLSDLAATLGARDEDGRLRVHCPLGAGRDAADFRRIVPTLSTIERVARRTEEHAAKAADRSGKASSVRPSNISGQHKL